MAAKTWVSVVMGLFLLTTVGEAAPRGGKRSAPGSFQLSSPANGATGQSKTPTLVWTAAARATSYRVTLGSFAPVSVATTSYTVPSGLLSGGMTYSWTVTAANAYGSTPASNGYFTFSTASDVITPPPPPPPPSVTTNFLTAVQYVGGSSFTAVGNGGTVVRSNDDGATWALQPTPTGTNLYSVSFVDSQIGTAVGGDPLFGGSVVLRTLNGGQSWFHQTSASTKSLLGVSFVSPSVGVSVSVGPSMGGAGATVMRTNDGGAAWIGQDIPNISLNEVDMIDTNVAVAVGHSGAILRTADGGISWSRRDGQLVTYSLRGVSFGSSTLGVAVGDGGTIRRSTDGGSTWSDVVVPATNNGTGGLGSVHMVNGTFGCAVGAYGLIRRTFDGGMTWTTVASGTYYDFAGVHFKDVTTGVAVGYGGLIYRTTNGGASWERRN